MTSLVDLIPGLRARRDEGIASRLNWLRAGVLGANDGIVSVAAIVVGVAGATTHNAAILTAGLAGLVGGAISMALGEYVSVSSQRDTQRALIAKEQSPRAPIELATAAEKGRRQHRWQVAANSRDASAPSRSQLPGEDDVVVVARCARIASVHVVASPLSRSCSSRSRSSISSRCPGSRPVLRVRESAAARCCVRRCGSSSAGRLPSPRHSSSVTCSGRAASSSSPTSLKTQAMGYPQAPWRGAEQLCPEFSEVG